MGIIIPPTPKKRKVSPEIKPSPKKDCLDLSGGEDDFYMYLYWGVFSAFVFSGLLILITKIL